MNDAMTQSARKAFGPLSERVFLAGFDGAAPGRVTLHVAQPKDRRALRAEARAALSRAGIVADCRVKALDYARLEKAGSLQELIACFGGEGVVYDPTGSVTRAAALVRCVERLRTVFGKAVRGAYLEPETRTLFLVYRPEALTVDARIDVSLQQTLQTQCEIVMERWRKEDAGSFELPLSLCLETPKLALVPVDRDSRDDARRSSWWNRLQTGMAGLSVLLTAAFAGQARAEGPAVSAVNGSLSAEGGAVNTQAAGVGGGVLAFPIGHAFGGQVSANGGNEDGRGLWDATGEAFWRDPEVGLFGGFGQHTNRALPVIGGSVQTDNYGAMGEAYAGRVTLTAVAGGQVGPTQHAVYGVGQVSWYPIDNLKLSAGGEFLERIDPTLKFGGEYQPGLSALPGLSAFSDIGITNAKEQKGGYVQAGFRYYFGATKSLIKRHREDEAVFPAIDGFATAARTAQTGQGRTGHY